MAVNPGVVFRAKRQVEIEDAPVPCAGPGEVLIRTRVTMISTGTELTILEVKEFSEDSTWARYGKFPFSARVQQHRDRRRRGVPRRTSAG